MATGNPQNPNELARESIKLLAQRRMPPTPENYARAYAEISGQSSTAAAHPLENVLSQVSQDLTAKTATLRAATALAESLNKQDWPQIRTILLGLAGTAPDADQMSWQELILELLREWEAKREGLTQGRKRESLEHVLKTFGSDPYKLYPRLRSLTKSWNTTGASEGLSLVDAPADDATTPSPISSLLNDTNSGNSIGKTATVTQGIEKAIANYVPTEESYSAIVEAWRELMTSTLSFSVSQRLGYSAEIEQEAAKLAESLQTARTLQQVQGASQQLRQFWMRLELRGETLDQMLRGLLTLLQLLILNMSDLSEDDRWVKGQVEAMTSLLNEPLTPVTLRAAERSFREFIYRQSTVKQSVKEAREAIKALMAAFVDRLGAMTESTGQYSEKFDTYAHKIRAATDLPSLAPLMESLLQDTRALQADVIRSRDELNETRQKAQAYEEKLRALEKEMEEISTLIREDALTNTLNRRGLEQAYAAEEARATRTGQPLCMALLDIDNFKSLNDSLGHQAGDNALVHLANIIKQMVRPSDSVARFGGEEFVILLPSTPLDEAEKVLVRLQRELTKRFFLHETSRIFITFSAGVAERREGEQRDALLERADAAMYHAKKSGKNRVSLSR
ncbi:sensor domain-containing diguanylate cyclase [Parvibium lacunae]|uniref:diguanylate cyclase n=1 Tax=Parvibium lacunae TaxID=1888893 RepID=A0A368KYC4_9BURK|nr:GGDEF domain-containing protein [Parvibium lacunae]RCS56453.1 GGDEF domain-containing protein [Parvibium lacunae]